MLQGQVRNQSLQSGPYIQQSMEHSGIGMTSVTMSDGMSQKHEGKHGIKLRVSECSGMFQVGSSWYGSMYECYCKAHRVTTSALRSEFAYTMVVVLVEVR
jgi:hypothetical protein